ncbi:F420-dependent oxidoreductase [Mycobacterium kubicae]|uniref:TIGR03667 family PPOX class F420-dependent oxidoreductase n=2 Tax=Mycobacterium kubicae TaxID=120959 RepID=A0AAX1JH36_9MYCO|nr:TIGR03667 family PPOX class F420-dependent oxidoreductase [Mycobacterium kubicae]MCV7096736.1 TIGR03667 family PPOX class F420-dependent oxidoreductase [Mycobacterium kubicae]OBK47234.1 PPOX class F420-dependent oxidoreductase [Mycobacterium kubicae]ORW01588.1 F420-dependent oxidoreductase [Mycobacterium kubicae]QNI10834.1 TIGR03667 family PPOX class F420-dependent oxidoreductase [Mycobacterium kubicae]QPI40562.1 TIGR03667 family PPOX class F420-dependent oxidoreductase [Mycobacterium kubic
MMINLSPEVSDRLRSDHYGWLTTVAKSGLPVPRLVWFFYDGTDLTVYTQPNAAKVAHIDARPEVSLNLDSDGNGGGIIVIGGTAVVDEMGVDCRNDAPYWAKYGDLADKFGLTDAMADYSTRLRIAPIKVWTTPTA